MGRILNFGRKKDRVSKKITLVQNIIEQLLIQLDSIRVLYKSTRAQNEINADLIETINEYDGDIVKVCRILDSINCKNYKTKEIFVKKLSSTRISGYELKEVPYNEKRTMLNFLLKKVSLLDSEKEIDDNFRYVSKLDKAA